MGRTCTTGGIGTGGINRHTINDRSILAIGEVVPGDVRPTQSRVGVAIGAAGIVYRCSDIALVNGQRVGGRTRQVIVIIAKTAERNGMGGTRVAGRIRG